MSDQIQIRLSCEPSSCAADTGAGVGRVTEKLLLHHFGTVDVLEPSAHLLDKARVVLADTSALEFLKVTVQADFSSKAWKLLNPRHAATTASGCSGVSFT